MSPTSARLGATRLQTVAGLAYDDLAESRQGYLNYVGDDLGVQGAVRRDEANHVYDFAQYLQAQWDPDAFWRLIAGVRNNLVEVSSNDALAGMPKIRTAACAIPRSLRWRRSSITRLPP